MVDCGNPSCVQERRSCRRDIQATSKKLPLILGLERIAADYVDEDTAKLFLNPYPALEQEESQDFVPLKRCFHCDKKLPNVYRRIQRIIDEAKNGKENNGKICLRSLQDLMPFCVDFYTHGFGQELFSDEVRAHFQAGGQLAEPKEEPETNVPGPAEIVDTLIVPHLSVDRSFRKQEAGKLGYTEEDLDCAVSDVRSGKIGTRRAAVIYGVPRSTIRNKIVKTEPEEQKDHCEMPNMAEGDFKEPDHVQKLTSFNRKEFSKFCSDQSKLVRSVLAHVPGVPFAVSPKLEPDDHSFFLEQHLNQIRRLHNLNGMGESRPPLAHSNHLKLPLLVNVVRKLVHQKFMEVKHDFGWKINSHEISSKHKSEYFSPVGSSLPTFSPSHAASHNNENHSAPVYKHIMKSIYTNMMRKDNPVPKPFGKINECSRIGDALKGIIAKSISEKIRIRDNSSDDGSLPVLPSTQIISKRSYDHCLFSLGATEDCKESKNSSNDSPPPKRSKKKSQTGNHSEVYSGFCSTKKTRPKRGQYRKYNSQLLMDAVKAVQQGEMSVHRAGSYYGVPHSTLEYKVKERHLLRQKKQRDMQSPPSSSRNGEATTTNHNSSRDSSLTFDDDILFTSKKQSSSSSARSSVSSASSTSSLTSSTNKKISQSSKSVSLPSSSSSPILAQSGTTDVASSKHLNSLAWFQPYLASQNLDFALGSTSSSLSLNHCTTGSTLSNLNLNQSAAGVTPSSLNLNNSTGVTPSSLNLNNSTGVTPSSLNLNNSTGVTPSSLNLSNSTTGVAPSSLNLNNSTAVAPSSLNLNNSTTGVAPSSLNLNNSTAVAPSSLNLNNSTEVTPSSLNLNNSTEVTPSNLNLNNSTTEVTPSSLNLNNSTTEVTPSSLNLNNSTEVTPSSLNLNNSTAVTPSSLNLNNSTTAVTPSSLNLNNSTGVTPSSLNLNNSTGVTSSNLNLNNSTGVTPSNLNLNNSTGVTPSNLNLNNSTGVTPSSLNLNNSASELLIRLQHRVQAQEPSFPRDGSFSLSCLKEHVFELALPSSSGGIATLSDQLALYNESA